eukprot:c9294_g1_i2.p3 GENE.c9294_g1_i2~~c9294_g1_i2.p3  ORF type:complete len:182 (+),score=51.51 c9294_g1_i2:526-1071(+)
MRDLLSSIICNRKSACFFVLFALSFLTNTFSEDELRILLEDQDQFDMWFGSLSEVEAKTEQLVLLMQQSAELAGTTLSQEETYNQLRQEVNELRNKYVKRKAALDAMQAEQVAKVQQMTDPSTLVQRLQQAINEAERQSEDTARNFCNGEMQCSDFIREFKEQRKLYHIRNAKKEMLLSRP